MRGSSLRRHRSDRRRDGALRRWLVPGAVILAVAVATIVPALPAVGAEETASVPPPATAGTFWSLLPPLLAIALAIVTRDVLVSLLLAVYTGALLIHGPNPLIAFARTIDGYVLQALVDPDHASILIFSALLGAMVGVITKSGGTQGIVDWLAPRATDARRGQLATWGMGIAIFFDDYASAARSSPSSSTPPPRRWSRSCRSRPGSASRSVSSSRPSTPSGSTARRSTRSSPRSRCASTSS
jgi:hypothetical protein